MKMRTYLPLLSLIHSHMLLFTVGSLELFFSYHLSLAATLHIFV